MSILSSPLFSCCIVLVSIRLVDMCNFRYKRIVWIRVCQHRADGEQDFANSQCWTPLITQNVQADAAVGVDVGVVYASLEVDLGRLERVVCGEVDGEEENAVLIW